MDLLHLIIMFLTCFACLLEAVTVPVPLGAYEVDSFATELIDISRLDPYEPTSGFRRIMVSAFFPAVSRKQCHQYYTPYMPPQTAQTYDKIFSSFGVPAGTFETLHLSLCRYKPSSMTKMARPMALFSPGLGNSRLIYSALAQTLASHGVIVLTIDHPHDASIVTFPDNTTVLAAEIDTESQITRAVSIREADLSFVIKSLNVHPRLANLPNHKNVTVLGHSLGGAAALSTALNIHDHIAAAINLDGTIFGPALSRDTFVPTLLFGHEGKNFSSDPSWATTWPHLLGPKLKLTLPRSQHGTFSDLPVLADILGLRAKMPAAINAMLGSIDGMKALKVIVSSIVTFCDGVKTEVKAESCPRSDKGT